MTWTDLLRLEWLTKHTEKPLFYEEMSREGIEEKSLGILPIPLQEIFGTDTPLYMHIPDDQDAETPFLSIASIVRVPLKELQIDNTAQTLTKENLMAYVSHTHRPIGFIDVDEQKFEFVKEDVNTYLTILVIVRINGTIGVLIENNMDNFISISLLPDSITDKWIIMRTATVIPSQPPGTVPLLAIRSIAPLRRIKALAPAAPATAPAPTALKIAPLGPRKSAVASAVPPSAPVAPSAAPAALKIAPMAPKKSAAVPPSALLAAPAPISIAPMSARKLAAAPPSAPISIAPMSSTVPSAAPAPISIAPLSARKSAAAPSSAAAAPLSAAVPKESSVTAPLTISKIKPISKTIRRNANAATLSAANAP